MQIDMSGLDAETRTSAGLSSLPSIYQRPTGRKIQITKLDLYDSGTFAPMYMRPFESPSLSHLDHNAVSDKIQSRLDSIGGGHGAITPGLVSGISGSVLGFSASPVSNILIPNGWGTKRFTFIMHVTSESSLGGAEYYVLQGYTDHGESSFSGHVDDNMVFHINSFISISQAVNPQTHQIDHRIVDCKQILDAKTINASINASVGGMFGKESPDTHTMRPMDIFTGIQGSYVQNYGATTLGNVHIDDQRNRLRTRDAYSSRANNVPSQHLASMLSNWRMSTTEEMMTLNDMDNVSLMIQSSVQSSSADNDFITMLANRQGKHGQITTSFTLSELKAMIPGTPSPTYYKAKGLALSSLPTANNVGTWNGATLTNQVSALLANALPTLMIQSGLQKVIISGSNYTQGMVTYDVRCGDARSLVTGDVVAAASMMSERVKSEIMPDITMNNSRYVYFQAEVDMFKATVMDIKVDTEEKQRKICPAYCDSLFPPIVTPTASHFDSVVGDMEHLFKTIDVSTTSPTNSNTTFSGLSFPSGF